MRRIAPLAAVSCAAALALAFFPSEAPAQDKSPAAAPSASSAPAPSNEGQGAADAGAAPDKGPKSVTGYGYRDQPRPKGKGAGATATPRRRGAPVPAGPIATLPGFEMLADGSSRCFVQLTQSVQIEEKKAKGSITYVLKGAHVAVRNNENALVTVHFNTPVTRARLVPVAGGLAFIIELRANVTPTYKVVAGKEGSSILQVDFPKGSYLPTADAPPAQQAQLDGHK